MILWDVLVDKPTKHKIDILMAINRHRTISIDKICEITRLDRRTVDRYLDDIMVQYQTLKDSQPISFSLSRGASGEIKLDYVNYKSFQIFVVMIIEQNLTIDMMKKLLLGDKIHLLTYSDEHFVSLSTIKRRLSQIRHILAIYQVKIKNKGGTIEIVGDEKQIRLLAYTFFWLMYKGGVWPFQTIVKEKVTSVQQAIFGDGVDKWSFTNNEQMLTIIAINIIRYRKGYTLNLTSDWRNNEYFDRRGEILEKISEDFLFSEEEIIFLMVMILTQEKYYFNEWIRTEALAYHEKFQTPMLIATKKYFEYYSEMVYPISNEDKEKYFFFLLGNHLYSSVFNPLPMAIGSFIFSESYLERYPNLLKKIEQVWERVKKEVDDPLLDNRIFLFARYLLLSSKIHSLTLFEEPITILLETDLPLIAEQNIAKQLVNHFRDQYKFQVVSRRDLSNDIEVDLVISNNFLSELEHVGTPQMLLYIEDELRVDDFIRIERKLIELGKNN